MLECKARSNPVSWTIIVSQKGDFYETENTKISACHSCTGVIPVPYYRLLTFSKFCTESRQNTSQETIAEEATETLLTTPPASQTKQPGCSPGSL